MHCRRDHRGSLAMQILSNAFDPRIVVAGHRRRAVLFSLNSNLGDLMSALGQKRTCRAEIAMSALPPKADIRRRHRDVSFGP
jgi:hypothetical protein